MKGILVFGYSAEDKLESGCASWSGKTLDEIRKYYDTNKWTLQTVSKAVAYASKTLDKHKKCVGVELLEILQNETFLYIKFRKIKELDLIAESLKIKTQRILRQDKLLDTNTFLPFCSYLNNLQSQLLFKEDTKTEILYSSIQKGDWVEAYNQFKPISKLKDISEIWNNEDILSNISFATAKLSETSINLKYAFNNDDELKKFLKQQKQYREETELLRKRCIELNPINASYYSNLGYSHYSYVRELTQPGGRRDGRPMDDAEKALEYFNQALTINPTRINDLYRKGQLLSEMLPKLILFTRNNNSNKDKALRTLNSIKEGIICFETAINIWRNAEDTNSDKKRFYKEYVKCLYDVARAYSDLISNDWDRIQNVLGLDYNINENDKVTYIPENLKDIDKAIIAIEDCCCADNIALMTESKNTEMILLASYSGQIEGVYKLYSLGKYYFTKYWILSGYGQRTSSRADEYRAIAECYYKKALEFKWTKEKEKQSKMFIAEKLGRLYITQKRYEEAMTVLSPFLNQRRVDYYVLYTAAEILMLKQEYEYSKRLIDRALNDKFGNKEIWLGYFLKSCAELREGNLEIAKSMLEQSKKTAKGEGKENIDTLLIAQGYISIKEGDKSAAIKFFEMALDENPYRVSIQKRVPNWQPKENLLK